MDVLEISIGLSTKNHVLLPAWGLMKASEKFRKINQINLQENL